RGDVPDFGDVEDQIGVPVGRQDLAIEALVELAGEGSDQDRSFGGLPRYGEIAAHGVRPATNPSRPTGSGPPSGRRGRPPSGPPPGDVPPQALLEGDGAGVAQEGPRLVDAPHRVADV